MALPLEYIEKALPAVAIRGIVPIPDNDIRLEVGRQFSVNALLEAEKNDNEVVLLIQKETNTDNPGPEDLYEYGVVGKVIMKIKLPNGNYKVKIRATQRVLVDYFISQTPFFTVFVKYQPTEQPDTDEEVALIRMIVNEVIDHADEIFVNGKTVVQAIQGGLTSEKLANIVAFNLKIQEMDKYKYISTGSVNERLKMCLSDVEKEKYIKELENEINKSVRQTIDENQKEYYLREKMRAIQNELGDKAKKESEIDELREKILKKKMPEDIEVKAIDELARYESLPQNSAESGVIRSYLDLLVDLPWNEKTDDNNDLKNAIKVLDKGHFGLEKVKDRIVEYLAVKIATKKTPQTILCLVGPPGVGKTSLARGIAEALGREFIKIALGGVKDL